MSTLLALTFVFTLTALATRAGAHAPWKHAQPVAAPLLHHGKYARRETQRMRAGKCLPAWPVGFVPYWSMPEGLRAWARDVWLTRLHGAERAESDCAVIPYWPWLALASCESGRQWTYNGSSRFDGGFQFLPSTWRSAGGPERGYAYAYQAPAYVQYLVARSWLARTSWAQWPACSAALGLR